MKPEVALHHEQRGSEDGAVDGQQGQKNTEGVVERREEAVQHHFQNLDHRGNHGDLGEQTQVTEIQVPEVGPGQCAVTQDEVVKQVVDRDTDGFHNDDRYAQANRRLDLFGHGQEGTHTRGNTPGQDSQEKPPGKTCR